MSFSLLMSPSYPMSCPVAILPDMLFTPMCVHIHAHKESAPTLVLHSDSVPLCTVQYTQSVVLTVLFRWCTNACGVCACFHSPPTAAHRRTLIIAWKYRRGRSLAMCWEGQRNIERATAVVCVWGREKTPATTAACPGMGNFGARFNLMLNFAISRDTNSVLYTCGDERNTMADALHVGGGCSPPA